jgi:hypothetical protein
MEVEDDKNSLIEALNEKTNENKKMKSVDVVSTQYQDEFGRLN